jgi:hypothetical protein
VGQLRKDIAQKSLALLKEESQLFHKAMAFQAATIEAVGRGGSITDDGLRAAIYLSCYAFDMLHCGWNALIYGFYAVALHSVRTIDQATITALAVTLDPEIARKFLGDRLKDGDAGKALQKAIEAEDRDFGKDWGERRKKLRSHYSKFMHASRTAISPSIIIAADFQSAIPTFGGVFIERQCQRLGRLYADLAFKAAVDISQAFKTVLPLGGKLEQQFDALVELGKPLKDRWEKEMGFS